MSLDLKLLWFTENYYPNRGGMAQACDRITYHLRQKGITIDLIHFVSAKRKFKEQKLLHGTNYSFPIEEDVAHSLNLLWNFISRKKSENPYTHVIAFGGYLPILAAPVFSKWMEIPLITLIRGNDFDLNIFSPKKRELLLYALENSAQICSVSSEKATKIKKLLPHKNVHFIANGIDLSNWKLYDSENRIKIKWLENQDLKDKRLIGIFGHLKQKKGIELFIRAIQNSNYSKKIHLLLVGEIEEKNIELLNELEITYTLFQFLDRYELLPFYAASDVVAIPSHYEGMPNVLLEAGSLARTFIASKVDGMDDVLDEENSFLFQVGNLEQCTKAIRRFMKINSNELVEKGQKIEEEIRKNYTHSIETNHYIDLLKKTK